NCSMIQSLQRWQKVMCCFSSYFHQGEGKIHPQSSFIHEVIPVCTLGDTIHKSGSNELENYSTCTSQSRLHKLPVFHARIGWSKVVSRVIGMYYLPTTRRI